MGCDHRPVIATYHKSLDGPTFQLVKESDSCQIIWLIFFCINCLLTMIYKSRNDPSKINYIKYIKLAHGTDRRLNQSKWGDSSLLFRNLLLPAMQKHDHALWSSREHTIVQMQFVWSQRNLFLGKERLRVTYGWEGVQER